MSTSALDLADLEYRLTDLFAEHQVNGGIGTPLCWCGADPASHLVHLAEVVSTWLQREGIVGGPAGG